MADPLAHCWHRTRSDVYTYGAARHGRYVVVCCYCGTDEVQTSATVPDPGHGPHAPPVDLYTTPRSGEPCPARQVRP